MNNSIEANNITYVMNDGIATSISVTFRGTTGEQSVYATVSVTGAKVATMTPEEAEKVARTQLSDDITGGMFTVNVDS